jgi:hypothetical protein
MDLLERYLQAVKFFLPRPHQDDIVRELSENLISQIEDRQEELGRPLTEDEHADILRRHGHPMLVAGRYRSHQQLIGPVFFPVYLVALKAGLVIALLVTSVLALISAIVDGDSMRRALEVFFRLPGRGLMVFAWTTLVFAGLDLAQSRLKLAHTWDPRRLPKVVAHEHRIPRAESLFVLLITLGCLIWLLLVPQAPHLLLGPATAIIHPAPIWTVMYIPILALVLASAVMSLVDVIRPYWRPGRSLARLVHQGLTFAVCVVLLRAGEWVVARPGATLPGGASSDQVVGIINVSWQIGLVVACLISVIEIVLEVNRLRTRRSGSSQPGPAPSRATHGQSQ